MKKRPGLAHFLKKENFVGQIIKLNFCLSHLAESWTWACPWRRCWWAWSSTASRAGRPRSWRRPPRRCTGIPISGDQGRHASAHDSRSMYAKNMTFLGILNPGILGTSWFSLKCRFTPLYAVPRSILQTNFSVALLSHSEIKHSDLLFKVIWLFLTNQSALFQCNTAMLL